MLISDLPRCPAAPLPAQVLGQDPSPANTGSIHSTRRSFDDIFGAGPKLCSRACPPLVPVLVCFRRARQPSPVRPYTGLTWYRSYQIDTPSQTVARHSPKAGDHTQQRVLHDNADPFGKLSGLLAVCSAAYKSALMEISEPMMDPILLERKRPPAPRTTPVSQLRCGRLVRWSVSGVRVSQAGRRGMCWRGSVGGLPEPSAETRHESADCRGDIPGGGRRSERGGV